MKFTVDGVETTYTKIETNTEEIIKALKLGFGFISRNSSYFVVKRKDGLYWEYDVSHHGSPLYEYKILTNDPKRIRVYNAISELEESIKNIT
jgi:hypothetical protein